MKKLLPLLLLALAALFTPLASIAQTPPPVLSDTQLAEGLRSGFGTIITQTLTAGSIKVPAPKLMDEAEGLLVKANKADLSKRFNTALNDTVTRLTPKIAEALRASLKDLKFEDVNALLSGSSKAGTQFFQKSVQSSLRDTLLPVIRREIATANLTTSAKAMLDAAYPGGVKGATTAIGNLDYHIRDRAIAEAFKLIGEREAAVRKNPGLLTGNTLAQKVFATAAK
jgi:hypothetical protein